MNNCASIAPLPRSSAEQGPRLSQDSGVRILPPQPASAVCLGYFGVLGKHPRLPPLTGVCIGLRDQNIRSSHANRPFCASSLQSQIFHIQNFLTETWFATRGDRFDISQPLRRPRIGLRRSECGGPTGQRVAGWQQQREGLQDEHSIPTLQGPRQVCDHRQDDHPQGGWDRDLCLVRRTNVAGVSLKSGHLDFRIRRRPELQKLDEIPYISGMPKKRKRRLVSWEAIRITASPARMYGVVHAADEEAALAKAMRNL